MNKVTIIAGILILLGVIVYCRSGNFETMRNAAFSEFDMHLQEYDIDPALFQGPFLDITNRKRLIFRWYHIDVENADTLTLVVTVPSFFSSLRTDIGGVGGKPEAWKTLTGTRKKMD